LHDCGKLVLSVNWPDEVTRVEAAGATIEAEQACCGLDHARAGAYLLGVWGLPDEILGAVA
jgi:HD-like signal output (HDOD) protein